MLLLRSIGLFLCLFNVLLGSQLDVTVESTYVVLMNAETGTVLFEKNSRKPMHPASTTKIGTVLFILENYPGVLDNLVYAKPEFLLMTTEREKLATNYAAPPHYLEPDGSTFHLLKNERFNLRDLLQGALITSGNDATNVLAGHLEGSIPIFVEKLDAYVKSLGCSDTTFCNPHGLSYPDHKSTAFDIATLGRKALQNPLFCELMDTSGMIRPKTNLQKERAYKTSNLLLRPDSKYYYPKAYGMKTGNHRLAGKNLVAVAKNEERHLVAAIHKASTREMTYSDATRLFESAFNEPKTTRLLFKKDDLVLKTSISRANKELVAGFNSDITLSFFPSEEPMLNPKLHWSEFVLPVQIGDRVGDVVVYDQLDRILLQEPVFATVDVQKLFPFRIFDQLNIRNILVLIGVLTIVIVLIHRRRGPVN